MMRSAWIAALVGGVLFFAPAGRAAIIWVNGFKYSDPSFKSNVEVDLTDIAGVTGVKASSADGAVLVLDAFAPGQYGAWMGPWNSFSAFHAATVGDWELSIEFTGGGKANYDFVVNDFRSPFTSDSFPPAPTILAPTDGQAGVGQNPTFQWDNGGPHTGSMESLFAYVQSNANPAISEFASSSGGTLTLGSESWTPTVTLPPGSAYFLVQYETNENEDANVGNPVFDVASSTVADPHILWWSFGDLFSRDEITFSVVPEPATLSLLAMGACLPLLRRRR
ncbi:MAG: hypothetical protein SVV80_13935 [Planctomycetota bacterium]|nr:hypothetical protein [Planctomycetota bacterium]